MERGLLWLPLLGVFIWLAWAGWNEYQKVETYQIWAKNFQTSKYDLYAVLGLQGNELTWGKPTRRGPIDLKTISLNQIREIQLLSGTQVLDPQAIPAGIGKIAIALSLSDHEAPIQIPFSDSDLARKWYQYLQTQWQEVINSPSTSSSTSDSSGST